MVRVLGLGPRSWSAMCPRRSWSLLVHSPSFPYQCDTTSPNANLPLPLPLSLTSTLALPAARCTAKTSLPSPSPLTANPTPYNPNQVPSHYRDLLGGLRDDNEPMEVGSELGLGLG